MNCNCNSNSAGMFRFTTPIHEFVTDLDPNLWTSFIISYSQHGSIILEKTEQDLLAIEDRRDDPDMSGWYLAVQLTQEETALFNAKEKCYIQIRCKYEGSDVYASEIVMLQIDDVMNQTIM